MSKNNGYLYVQYDQKLVDKGWELKYAKPNDIGLDLPVIMDHNLKLEPSKDYYLNWEERWFDIPPLGIAEVPCGLAIKIPYDAWGNIKPRSSTGWKKRLSILEGVIDSDYTGPLFINVQNPNRHTVRVHEWDRLAQLIIIPKYHAKNETHQSIQIQQRLELPKTIRADSGFGSSGR